jgi:hypothetical protein
MRTLVARELKFDAGYDGWVSDFGVCKAEQGEEQQKEKKKTLTRPAGDLSRKRER